MSGGGLSEFNLTGGLSRAEEEINLKDDVAGPKLVHMSYDNSALLQ